MPVLRVGEVQVVSAEVCPRNRPKPSAGAMEREGRDAHCSRKNSNTAGSYPISCGYVSMVVTYKHMVNMRGSRERCDCIYSRQQLEDLKRADGTVSDRELRNVHGRVCQAKVRFHDIGLHAQWISTMLL